MNKPLIKKSHFTSQFFLTSLPIYVLLNLITPTALAAGLPSLEESSLDSVVVTAHSQDMTGVADTASEGTVTAKQLTARPLLRPAEVMETVPGMIVTQHSGDGKANQYFLRGFNLDHGSDFATYINGMPVNNVTHAHGQGYMDLNFLIPELVGTLRYRKGVYAAEDGDLAVTGSARIDYARTLTAPFLDLSIGEHGYKRGLLAGSQKVGDFNILGALELVGNDGPWDQPEGLVKRNGVVRLSKGTAADGFAITAMAYEANWTATEQVPERAIQGGEIGRYGTLAPTDGGKTHRYSVTGEWGATDATGGWRANAYVVDYGLNLFSTPSGPLDGQHEQADERITWGGQLARNTLLNLGGKETVATIGTQFRQDNISGLGLYQTVNRERVNTTRKDEVVENALALFADVHTQWSPWIRTTAGLRWDNFRADVDNKGGAFNTNNDGKSSEQQLSPKLGLVLGPFGKTEYYANWGKGFHSNDARGTVATTNPVDGSPTSSIPFIATATGSEIGVRTQPLPGWYSSVTLWQITLDSELVYIGDEGVTEPKGGSRRHGLEWSNYYSYNGLILDADVALSHAEFTESSNGGSHVPNAIPLTASFAATIDHGSDWFGGVRVRYLGAYPLEETGKEKSTPFWTANLKVGYRYDKNIQVTADILNLFDRKANDIEYFGSACTNAEGAGCGGGNGIDGRLIHPLEPRTLRLGMRVNF
ncbi:MAG TPA: TonB-dependent receptor [Methylotenera sp.]|nr:TonB-dependent receptor [Methylotenera sp.]